MATELQGDALAGAIEATRERLRRAGDAARATCTVDTRLVDGFLTEASARQFTFQVDEPEALGGADTAPTPVEYVLAALGACQEIVYATYARILGIPLEHLAIRVTGDLDPRGFFGVADVPAGFRSVQFDVQIASPAPPEQITRLIGAVNRHCPVLDILQRPLPVTGRYALNGQELPDAD